MMTSGLYSEMGVACTSLMVSINEQVNPGLTANE